MTEVLFLYYHHQSLNQTICRNIMSIIMAGVIADMKNAVKKVRQMAEVFYC